MDINITTNFNIGDRVWIPELYGDEWFTSREIQYHVSDIEVRLNLSGVKIIYVVKNNNGITVKYPEESCFSNYDECKKWCKTH